MKTFLGTILTFVSLSTFANDFVSDFERGFNAGVASCNQNSFYICSADDIRARLKIRSSDRSQAIKDLYNYCLGPSGNNYRSDCALIVNQDKVFCKKI